MNQKSYDGINIQWPISVEILNGKKTVETRTYPLPSKYLNKEMLLIETPGPKGDFKARIVGIIKFTSFKKYRSKKDFYSDYLKHKVSSNSPWSWKNKPKWGWEVEVVKIFNEPIEFPNDRSKGIIYTNNITI